MLMWIYRILVGNTCQHTYETIQEGSLIEAVSGSSVGKWYDCCCTKCGNIKRFRCSSS